MDTIDLDTVRSLAQFRAQRGRALSLYLDLDPSTTPTAAELDSRIGSLLSRAREEAQGVESHEGRVGLGEDLARIEEFFGGEFERDGARGLALFTDGPDGLWRVVELPEPVEDALSVGDELNLAPLAPLLGRQEALVAFVGRERGLVLALRGGRLEPVAEQFDEVEGRHSQGGWSQARFQRHIEQLVQEHLKDVASRVERELRKGGAKPLVLVGTEETTASFREQLSVEAQAAVAGVAQAEAHATPAELLEIVAPVLEEAAAARERDVLERWREAVAREEGRGAAGWEATLASASDGKVACLLFTDGAAHPAVRCGECGRVEAAGETCPLDGAPLEPVADGLDAAIRQALTFGGELIPIRHHQDLDPVGGIGALLRF
jgi:peptide chain release factor subunit 1